MKIKDKLVIKSKDLIEPLNSVLSDSFQITQTLNQSYQLQFTAYDDKSVSYSLIQPQNSVLWEGQEFIIKQCQPQFSQGVTTNQVTAIHIGYEVQRVFQHNVNTGVKSYSVNDVLSFYLNGNPYGYTWKVIGDFNNQQIENLGNSNGSDMLSKIKSTWSNSVFYPDNKCIQIFSMDAFKKETGKVITYKGNTNSVQLSYDSTNLVNKLYCISDAKDGSDSNNPQYYFQPFYVTDDNSINQYGVFEGSPVSDNRFHDANSMRNYAQGLLQPTPALSIQCTFNPDIDDVQLGEIRHLIIPENNLSTDVTVSQITLYPLSDTQSSQCTLDNVAKTILDYNNALHNRTQNTVDNSVEITAAIQNSIDNNRAEIDRINSAIKNDRRSYTFNGGNLTATNSNGVVYVELKATNIKENTTLCTIDFKPLNTLTGNMIVTGNSNYIINYELDNDGILKVLDLSDLTGKKYDSVQNVSGQFTYVAQ